MESVRLGLLFSPFRRGAAGADSARRIGRQIEREGQGRPTQLAAAGFHNPRNEAMLALIDPDAADGQAPGSAGTPFACVSCPANPPLFYATFPRSELNLVTGSPFNRAEVALGGDRVLVTTSETERSTATAIYEFDGH